MSLSLQATQARLLLMLEPCLSFTLLHLSTVSERAKCLCVCNVLSLSGKTVQPCFKNNNGTMCHNLPNKKLNLFFFLFKQIKAWKGFKWSCRFCVKGWRSCNEFITVQNGHHTAFLISKNSLIVCECLWSQRWIVQTETHLQKIFPQRHSWWFPWSYTGKVMEAVVWRMKKNRERFKSCIQIVCFGK